MVIRLSQIFDIKNKGEGARIDFIDFTDGKKIVKEIKGTIINYDKSMTIFHNWLVKKLLTLFSEEIKKSNSILQNLISLEKSLEYR